MEKYTDPLVGELTGFQSVRIPLLSDEECKVRGIERPRLPPFETWSDEQQKAGRRFGDILARMTLKQAWRCVLRQLDRMIGESYDKADFEKEAARRALEELRAGKWRADRDEVNGLQTAMCWVLEGMLREGESKPRKRARKQ